MRDVFMKFSKVYFGMKPHLRLLHLWWNLFK